MKITILTLSLLLGISSKATIFNQFFTTNQAAFIQANGAAYLGVNTNGQAVSGVVPLSYSGATTNVFVNGAGYALGSRVAFTLTLTRPAFIIPTNCPPYWTFTVDYIENSSGTFTRDFSILNTAPVYTPIATNAGWHNLDVFHMFSSTNFTVGTITNGAFYQ